LLNNHRGFTLMELIVAILVVAVLLAVVYRAVNPEKRIVDTKNAVRLQEASAIEKAIKSALISGTDAPASLTNVTANTYYSLISNGGTPGTYACSQLGQTINTLDIASTVTPFLGGALPVDPDITSGINTGYYLIRRGNLFDVGYCNWSIEVTCGDSICSASETCSSCATDCGSCSQAPIVSDAGRVPIHNQIGVAMGGILSWTAWTKPGGGTVEYYVTLYIGTSDCTGTLYQTPTWSTDTSFNPSGFMHAETLYSWQLKARTQGENDDTAYNTCYEFFTETL